IILYGSTRVGDRSDSMKNISLTHRIVGAIVILSLAVIFIPLLLETDQFKTEKQVKSPIPEIPEDIKTIVFERKKYDDEFKIKNQEDIQKFENTVKERVASSAHEEELKETPKPEKSKPAEEKKAFPVKSNKPYKHTWMLQLASYKNQKSAEEFRNKLRNAGYVSNLDEKKLENGGSIWRVRVGPYVRQDEANRALQRVNKQFKVKGILVQRR
ncbi:MAG: SPOR domain-containing protein, partial [Gammaproteobacteria bacterium]|nr:SPOR domain-containing protein [Gammaproteobacteria bacterium]